MTELLTQWADLTNAAIAATGHADGWYRGAIQDKKPWDPTAEDVALDPCGSIDGKEWHQLANYVTHVAFEHDPHPIADTLTAYWKSQGFTVTRTIDWTDPTGRQSVEIAADRDDGVQYGLTATTELVAIDVSSECSADSSIDDWAEKRVQQRLESLHPSPSPSPSPAAEGAADSSASADDDRFWF